MNPRPLADPFAPDRIDDQARSPFDLKVLVLYGLARFRRSIVVLGVLGAVFGLLAGAAQPNVYAANAKLRFVPSARQALTEEAAFGVEIREFRGRMSSAIEEELELLRDPVIYERVVDQIGAAEILRVADPRSGDGASTALHQRFMHALQAGLLHLKGQDDPLPDGGDAPWARAAAAGKLMAATTVRAVARTNIIDVIYSDSSPAKAKTICDEIVRQMRARHLEEFQAQKQLVVLKETKTNAYQEMRKAREEALEFKNQCGFFDLDSDFQACQEQIRANSLLEQSLEQDRQRLLGQIKALEEELGLRSAGVAAEDGSQPFNPEWVSLQTDISKINELIYEEEVKATPGEISQRRLERYRAQKEKLEARLADTDQFGARSGLLDLGENANEALINTQTLLSTAKGELEGVISQIEVVREQLKDLERRRRTMEECRVEHVRLENAVKSAEAKYEDLTDNELKLSSLATMDEEDRSNLSLFREPRLPRTKVGPNRTKPLALGMMGLLGLGLGGAVLRQFLDRRVRYRETVENQLGMAVLCTLPDLARAADVRESKGVA